MATSVDLISHGAGEGICYCLNAMAALFHGGKHSYIGSLIYITSMFAAAVAIYKMVLEQSLQIPANWLLFNSMVVVALTIPTVNVTIIDKVTNYHGVVANVPWLFAVPAGYISQIGDIVAKKIDSSLAVPSTVGNPVSFIDVITANRNGVAMTAKLVANASHFDFVSYDMANNMREFVKECVYYDLAFMKYTIDELKNSDNLWHLVSENASPLGGVIYQETITGSQSKEREFLTCKDAAARIQAAWPQELNKAYDFYGKKLFPFGGGPTRANPENLLKQNIVHAYTYLTGISKSADDLMQQNIMRNAIQDGFLTRAQEDGASASIQSYAVSRAEAYQASVYATQGGVAEKAVSYMKIVIEIIFYGIFPFVSIMLVLPGGIQMLKTYFTGLIWLQSWAPLYSLINMIVHVYCRGNAELAVATVGGPALTFDTIPSLGEAGISIARYAGYAMMSVPFLSWGLFKYGGGALAQMSTYMGQPTQSASGMAAQEVSSGNLSLGIRNFDSTSRSMVNSFKQDDNASVASGSTSYQTPNGTSMRLTSGGDVIMDKAMSKLGFGINDKNEIASSMSEMSSKSLSQAQTSLTGYGSSVSAAYNRMQDYKNSMSNSVSSDSSIGTDQSSSLSKAFQQADDLVDSVSKSMGFDRRKSVEWLSVASLGGTISGGVSAENGVLASLGGKAGAHLSLEGRRQGTSSKTHNLNTASTEQLHMGKKFMESLDNVNRVSQSESFRNSSTEAKNFSDGFSNNLSEADTHRKDMQNSLTESEAWQKSANLVSTSSVGVTSDLSQEFVNSSAEMTDAYGNKLGFGGVERALEDPVQRQSLIKHFVASHREEITNSFGVNRFSDESSIRGSYNNSMAAPGEENIRSKYDDMSQTVIAAAEKDNLNQHVGADIKDKGLQQMSDNRKTLDEHQQKVMTRKSTLQNMKNNLENTHPHKDK